MVPTDFTLYMNEFFRGSMSYHASLNYGPKELTFKVGETVNFTLIPTPNSKNRHTFTVKDLGIHETAAYGKVATFSHTFDKPGRFRLICQNHNDDGTRDWIIIE